MPSPAEAEIEHAIEQFFHAMDTQDAALMDRLVAPDADTVHIGTGAGEVWRGGGDLQRATAEQFASLESYEAHVKDLVVNVAASGDVAWYFHRLDARITSGGTEQRWRDARFTGVFEKRNGRWVMVQTHVSLPDRVQP